MSNTTPRIQVSIDGKGDVSAKIYGARTCWCRIDQPEPDIDTKTKVQKTNADGSLRVKWRTQLLVPKGTPGAADLRSAAEALRKRNGGAGKIAAVKDGDLEIARQVAELGKKEEDLAVYKGMVIITASTSRKPDIRGTDIYSGCEAAAGIRLHWFSNETKGVSAFLNAIVKTGPGERIGGGGGMSADDLDAQEYREEPADPLAGSSSRPGPDDWGV